MPAGSGCFGQERERVLLDAHLRHARQLNLGHRHIAATARSGEASGEMGFERRFRRGQYRAPQLFDRRGIAAPVEDPHAPFTGRSERGQAVAAQRPIVGAGAFEIPAEAVQQSAAPPLQHPVALHAG